ncbi:unnamed protein product [Cuscuta europaea]|uniref:Uncharacterized protein n=1 Tax=Cuscuta europaea TaxID=41803 RepID=A0A9P1EAR4_CUSEU|nr:unnamed protein product [Cuscuta europaea]
MSGSFHHLLISTGIFISSLGMGSLQDWPLRHVRYISMWERRAEIVVTGMPTMQPSIPLDYMGWYYTITELFASPSFKLPTHNYQPSSVALHLMVQMQSRHPDW